jgi:hypothetical protein
MKMIEEEGRRREERIIFHSISTLKFYLKRCEVIKEHRVESSNYFLK